MKAHKTVTLTRKMLEQSGACEDGIDQVADLLPAVISTDPLDNLALADEALQFYPKDHACCGPEDFVRGKLGGDSARIIVGCPDYDHNGAHGGDWSDPYVLAQQLAGWADSYLVARGQ